MCEYNIDKSEDGCFWRLLGEDEAALFRAPDATTAYGLARQEALSSGCRALATCSILAPEARKILMGVSRKFVLQWVGAKDGDLALLRVSRADLKDHEFERLGPGVAVLGEAAVRLGDLLEPDEW